MKEEVTMEDVINAGTEADNTQPSIVVRPKDLLSTGSTLLNLAISDRWDGGWLKGYYYYIVGDTDSGKTWFSMTCFAETSINPNFKDYRLIRDDTEKGSLIDVDACFNEETADRIEPPARDADNQPVTSATVEDFYDHLDDAIKEEKPFVYVLDSQDGLTSEAADKKFDKNKKIRQKQKDTEDEEGEDDYDENGKAVPKIKGSYGDGKAAKNSEGLRKALTPLYNSNSILIITGQTRDAINTRFPMKTRAGGWALIFYATVQIWTSIVKKHYKEVNGIKRHIGNRIKIQIKRSRINGKQRTVEVDIYTGTGIDDIGSCVDYLVAEGWWKKTKETINAKEFTISATRDKLIRLIEKKNLEDKLRALCGKCWADVEEALVVKRKNKYQL